MKSHPCALVQDAGELSHAHETLQLACDAADGAGPSAAADRVTAHAAAAVNAARAVAAGPAAGLTNAVRGEEDFFFFLPTADCHQRPESVFFPYYYHHTFA